MTSASPTRRAIKSAAPSSRSPTSACSSAWPATSTAWCTCPTCRGPKPAKKPCVASRKVTNWKPSFWPSTSSASAFPWALNSFAAMNDKGALMTGTVKSVEPKGAVIQLSEEVEGYLRASEISRDRVEDAGTHLKVGDSVEALVINIDRKARSIQLSIKAKDNVDTQEAMQKIASTDNNAASGTTSLGALLKAKFDNKN